MEGTTHFLIFIYDLFLGMVKAYSSVSDFFLTVYTLPNGVSFSVFELIFTTGLVTFLAVTIVKWIIGIVT